MNVVNKLKYRLIFFAVLFFAVYVTSCKVSSPLYGTWASNSGDKLILDKGDSCVMYFPSLSATASTQSGSYSVLLNMITFSMPNGTYVFEWDVRGKILYLTYTDNSASGGKIGISMYKVE